jgi:lycopene cyclase domain-containing protein
MMFTYLIMNLIFMLSLIFFLPKDKITTPPKAFWVTLVVLLVLTAIFDPIIIGIGMVGYNESLLLGLNVFGAPIEDFFYAIYAACAVPLIWHMVGEKKRNA